jgi:methylglyoxal synthase
MATVKARATSSPPKAKAASPPPNETPPRRRVALIAHDHRKADLLEWARYNRESLVEYDLVATGTTGSLIAKELGLAVTCVESGPLGGDLQIGAMIAEGSIDLLVFFWDPLEPQPHDPDVKALLRVAVVWNILMACNRATADFVISSPLMKQTYTRATRHYGEAMKPEPRAAAALAARSA